MDCANPVTMGAGELAAAIRCKEFDPVEVAEAFVAEVEASNPALNAIVRFDAAAFLAEAHAAARRLSAGDRAPLLGVPFTVKDNIWVEGRTVCQGSCLFEDFVAPVDAIAVARLRAAGAVVMGTTNCSEFACKGVTTNLLHGPTRNPWNLARTPGGSSGGAAAAVSAGLGPLALCTDGGGSTRRPAAHTGVVGFKPSAGLIPHPIGFREPVFGNSVIGLMARRVADTALTLDLLAGSDPRDPLSPPWHLPEPRAPHVGASLEGLRVAFSPRLGLDVAVDPLVATRVKEAAAWIEQSGAVVEEADPIWPGDASEESLAPLQLAGLAALYGDAWQEDPGRFDPDIGGQIEAGLALPATCVAQALFLRETLLSALAALFEHFDLLFSPTTPCVAWPLDRLGPARIEGREVSPRAHAVFTPFFNHTYLPACSVPCGLAEDGLPAGAQIVGRRFEDALVARAAAVVEAGTGGLFARPRRPEL